MSIDHKSHGRPGRDYSTAVAFYMYLLRNTLHCLIDTYVEFMLYVLNSSASYYKLNVQIVACAGRGGLRLKAPLLLFPFGLNIPRSALRVFALAAINDYLDKPDGWTNSCTGHFVHPPSFYGRPTCTGSMVTLLGIRCVCSLDNRSIETKLARTFVYA